MIIHTKTNQTFHTNTCPKLISFPTDCIYVIFTSIFTMKNVPISGLSNKIVTSHGRLPYLELTMLIKGIVKYLNYIVKP